MLLAVQTWNILSTIVLVATLDPGIHILFTFLNWILFVTFGTYVFYLGYYGIAKREGKKLLYYKIGQCIQIVLYLLLSIFPFGAINGWAKIPKYSDEGDDGNFGVATVVMESLTFTVLCGLGCWSLWLIHTEKVTFNQYADRTSNFS